MDITPQQPVTLAGYESRKDLSEGVHDPLSARVIAFEQDRRRLVLVSIDNLGFYNDTAAPLGQAILDACGLKPSELFLCAIHTHSAPALTLNPEKGHSNNVAYTRALQGKLVEAVRAALAGLAPVELTDKKLLSRRHLLLNAARVDATPNCRKFGFQVPEGRYRIFPRCGQKSSRSLANTYKIRRKRTFAALTSNVRKSVSMG